MTGGDDPRSRVAPAMQVPGGEPSPSAGLEVELELSAYFDGELDEAAAAAFEQRLAGDPDLRDQLAELQALRLALRDELEARAQEVSSARFEQVWDEIDRAVRQDERLRNASEGGAVSLAADLRRFLSWLRTPLLVGVGASLVTLAVVRWQASEETGEGSMARTSPQPAGGELSPAPAKDTQRVPAPPGAGTAPRVPGDALARAPEAQVTGPGAGRVEAVSFPAAESNDAFIERVDFGERTGRITTIPGQRGTTTVIWVVEDEEPDEKGRSL